MKIREITNIDNIDILLSIIETYTTDTEQLQASGKQLLEELGEAGDNRHIFIGEENGVVVAMIQIIIKNADNDPDYANGREIAHVHNLQVRKNLQGQGIGLQMMEFIEEKARQMGKKILTLGVDDCNNRAIRLYKKLAYEVFKESPGRFPEERVLSMRKEL